MAAENPDLVTDRWGTIRRRFFFGDDKNGFKSGPFLVVGSILRAHLHDERELDAGLDLPSAETFVSVET
jgi:hypothetical protein